jgi:hypothetical protein
MRASSNVHVIVTVTFMVLILAGSLAHSLLPSLGVGAAEGAQSKVLIVNALSLPSNGSNKPISVPVEIWSGDHPPSVPPPPNHGQENQQQALKKGNTPMAFVGKEGATYVVKVNDNQQFTFDHWKDGDTNSVKQVKLSKSLPVIELTAFFKKKTEPPSPSSTLVVNALTANGEPLHMSATIRSGKAVVKTGLLTPFTFHGTPGKTYTLTLDEKNNGKSAVAASSLSSFPILGNDDSGGNKKQPDQSKKGALPPLSVIFNHWNDTGNTNRVRSITMPANDGGVLKLVGIYNKGDRVTLEDLGVLQLVSHDLYNTIRDGPNPGSIEDERLNLSTLLDHGDDQIILGGEPRNSENIAIHTVAVNLGKMYLGLVGSGIDPADARNQTIQVYLAKLEKAYNHAFHEPLPAPAPNPHEEKPDSTENLTGDLSLRAVHSYVPGHIMVNGVDTPILDPSLRGKTLSAKDMQQLSKPLDGTFDPVFRNVTIFLPPPNPPPNLFTIDLFERDSSFAKQFGTDVSFEEFMGELKDGRFDKDEQVMNYLREDVAAGLLLSSSEEDNEEEVDD